MSNLEKAIRQEHLTSDTVYAQFCSDWLKDEIKRLFDKVKELESRLAAAEKVVDAARPMQDWASIEGHPVSDVVKALAEYDALDKIT